MENSQQKQKHQPPRMAVIRAFPAPGHIRRWGGHETWINDERTEKELNGAARRPPGKHGLPWPASEVKVEIVDEPEPFDPTANGGVPRQISPRSLKMLMTDPRISVHVLGDGHAGADPAETVRMAAELAEYEEKIQKARRDLADAGERAAAEHQKYQFVLSATEKRAIDATAKVTQLEAEIAMLREQLAEKKGGKK